MHIGTWETCEQVEEYIGFVDAVSIVIDENKPEELLEEFFNLLQEIDVNYLKLITEYSLFFDRKVSYLELPTGAHLVSDEIDILFRNENNASDGETDIRKIFKMERVEVIIKRKAIKSINAMIDKLLAVPESVRDVYIEFKESMENEFWAALLYTFNNWDGLIFLELAGKIEPFFVYHRKIAAKWDHLFMLEHVRFSNDSAIVDYDAFGYMAKLFPKLSVVVPVSVGGNMLEADVEKLIIALNNNQTAESLLPTDVNEENGATATSVSWEQKTDSEARLNGAFMLMLNTRVPRNTEDEKFIRHHILTPPSLQFLFDDLVQSVEYTKNKIEV